MRILQAGEFPAHDVDYGGWNSAVSLHESISQLMVFRLSFEEAAVGLAQVALDGTWLRANKQLCTILGYTVDELRASSFQHLTHPEDLVEDLTYVDELLRGERHSYGMRKRYLRKDGETVWAKLTVSLLRDDNDDPICFISVVEDISALVAMEQALRQSEERYRRVVEDQTDLICRYSPDLTLTFINEPYARLCGRHREELIGKNLLDTLPPDSQTSMRATVAALSAANPTVSHEDPWSLSDGSLRWFHWTHHVILDASGHLCEYQGVGRDITDRKAAEAAEREQRLLAEKEQTEAILDNSPNAKFLLNSDLEIQRTNRVVQTLFACAPADCLGRSILAFVTPTDRQCVRQAMELAPDHDTIHDSNIVALRSDGTTFPAELSIGRIQRGFVCTVSDITERKAYERTLKYHASLQAHVSDAVISKDATMRIQSWNSAAEKIYGWRAEEVIGKFISEVILTEESAQEREQVSTLLQQQGWWQGEVIQRRKDGTRIRVLRSVTLLQDERGQPQGFVTVNHDVTALHEAIEQEKELVRLKARMAAIERERELTELKQRFVYMASHEFRTPIATIHALAETLSAYRQRMEDEQIDVRLEKICTQSTYLASMVEDVLQLASLEARKTEFHPTHVKLDELCRTVIAEFQNGMSCPQAITLACYTADTTVAVTPLLLDQKLIRQVINNLLSNAQKYSPPESTIAVQVEYFAETVTISVHDQGIGIPADEINHLFEPFHRAPNAETIHGTGLGLTIVKEAVDLHGGIVTVHSKLNGGTTFCVRLPRE